MSVADHPPSKLASFPRHADYDRSVPLARHDTATVYMCQVRRRGEPRLVLAPFFFLSILHFFPERALT